MAHIGKSITILGDVTGDEDLVVDGRVEGGIDLPNHHLTIGPNGIAEGELFAKEITVLGRVKGKVEASDRVDIKHSGYVEGGVTSPRLHVEEGAVCNGQVSMAAPKRDKAPAASAGMAMPKRPQPVASLDGAAPKAAAPKVAAPKVAAPKVAAPAPKAKAGG